VFLLELLDDHQDALKAREGEVADLCRGMEELSVAEKAVTKEISRLKVDLGREMVTRSSQKEKLVQLRGELEKKGSKMLKRDSELQQKRVHCWRLSKNLRRCGSVQIGQKLP